MTVKAVVDPERATQSVRFERRVGERCLDRARHRHLLAGLPRDQDDVEALPLGTTVSYRAILLRAGLTRR